MMGQGTPTKCLPVAVMCMASLFGCATSELRETANVDAQFASSRFPIKELSLGTATALSVNETIQFQSASLLVAQRPKVKQEITELELTVMGDDKHAEQRSVMRFSTLPTGLNYYSHSSSSGWTETSIDLFGVGSIVNWNSRFPYAQFARGIVATSADQVRLVEGHMYAGDSAFALEIKNADGAISRSRCVRSERIPAKVVHQKLAGMATLFKCKDSSGDFVSNSEMWYFEEYARYVTQAIYDDDGYVQSRFSLRDIKFN